MTEAPRRYEAVGLVAAAPAPLFTWLDDPRNLAGHMESRSMAMMGSAMTIEMDSRGGREVGSVIRMRGRALGIPLFLEEAISQREAPRVKAWRTVGEPRLLVIGSYELGFEIVPESAGSRLRVFIEYELPAKSRWLGLLLGGFYAKWCCERMLFDAQQAFSTSRAAGAAS